MQGRGRGWDSFFGSSDPFTGFGGFGGFGGHGSLLPDFFGGRVPFDDPFFTCPFGSMFGRTLSGSMFESGFFGPGVSPFPNVPPVGFIENQQPQPEPQPNKHRGPIIEEINSDDENKEGEAVGDAIPIKHSRLEKDPFVEYPDDAADERKSKHVQFTNKMNNMPPEPQCSMNYMAAQPQSQCFSFQSSSVTYGGADGAYYTKSTTRRTGSDGVMFEEHKEADSSTGQATHQVSRGLHKKGHTLTRKLNSDGRVDSRQTLHNLNEDELTGFEEAWKGNAKKRLPGLSDRFNRFGNFGSSTNGDGGEQTGRSGWALPSSEPPLPQQNGKRAWSHLDLNATAPQPPQNSGSGHPINGTHGQMRT